MKFCDFIKLNALNNYFSEQWIKNPKIIKPYFNSIQLQKIKYKIADKNIYNFNKTKYTINFIATTKIVIKAKYYKKYQIVQQENREWVTSIKYINTIK